MDVPLAVPAVRHRVSVFAVSAWYGFCYCCVVVVVVVVVVNTCYASNGEDPNSASDESVVVALAKVMHTLLLAPFALNPNQS